MYVHLADFVLNFRWLSLDHEYITTDNADDAVYYETELRRGRGRIPQNDISLVKFGECTI
jgi:hypothetical protein